MKASEAACAQWVKLVSDIRGGAELGVERLYQALSDSARSSLAYTLGAESVDDHLQDIIVIVLEAIQKGTLQEPSRLPGFVRTVTRRRIIAGIRVNVRCRLAAAGLLKLATSGTASPEAAASAHEQSAHMRRALRRLCRRDQEILARFYLNEQEPDQICGEMHLTRNQFRLYKSRALHRCLGLLRKSQNPPLHRSQTARRAGRITPPAHNAAHI